jgi:hypothetical protein
MASALPYVAAPFTGGTSLVGALGGKNLMKTPTPPEAIKPATVTSKPVQQAVAEAAQRRSKARGFFSTILSQLGNQAAQASPSAAPLKSTFGS